LNNRKNISITDKNYDFEYEKICEENGYPYCIYSEFVEKLSSKFFKSTDENGCEIWCEVTFKPNYAIDCSSAIEEYQIAYEFANGFMVFHERSSFYD
jgi:hypothetical protein